MDSSFPTIRPPAKSSPTLPITWPAQETTLRRCQGGVAGERNHQGVHVHRVPSTGFGRGTLAVPSTIVLPVDAAMHGRTGTPGRRQNRPAAHLDHRHGGARRKGASLVNWLQDIYPETAVALGVRSCAAPSPRA
jgi:hypothetical protein